MKTKTLSVKNEQGVILLLSAIILVLAASLALEFYRNVSSHLQMTMNLRDTTRARFLAESGFNASKAILKRNSNNYDSLDEEWAREIPPMPVEYGFVKVIIVDEERKLNLNSLVDASGDIDGKWEDVFQRLFKLSLVNESILNSILDWLDGDDTTRIEGAESDYYKRLYNSYSAKNGKFDTLEELFLVKGINEENYYGKNDLPGLKELLTVYSSGKININTATKEVLMSLDEEISEDLAEQIIEFRSKTPFQSILGIKTVIGMTQQIYNRINQKITVKSEYFRVYSYGYVNDIEKGIEAVLHQSSNQIETIYYRIL